MNITDHRPVRPPTLAERFDPRPQDDARYETAIARRNTTWCHWREAADLLAAAGLRGVVDLAPYIGNLNDRLRDYEHAATDLIRARVFWRRSGVPW